MRTLWIRILGFSSGRTGLVVTDGGKPYDEDDYPLGDIHGVVNRFHKEGVDRLMELSKEADTIKILSYDGEKDNEVSVNTFQEALDPWKLLQGNDSIAELMPE